MSVITGISVAVPQVPTATVAAGSNDNASQAQTASQPPTTGDSAQPAVVVSLSAGAAAQVSSSPPSMDPNQVDDALADLSGANGFAFLYAHYRLCR
jgi:hypothetical protein